MWLKNIFFSLVSLSICIESAPVAILIPRTLADHRRDADPQDIIEWEKHRLGSRYPQVDYRRQAQTLHEWRSQEGESQPREDISPKRQGSLPVSVSEKVAVRKQLKEASPRGNRHKDALDKSLQDRKKAEGPAAQGATNRKASELPETSKETAAARKKVKSHTPEDGMIVLEHARRQGKASWEVAKHHYDKQLAWEMRAYAAELSIEQPIAGHDALTRWPSPTSVPSGGNNGDGGRSWNPVKKPPTYSPAELQDIAQRGRKMQKLYYEKSEKAAKDSIDMKVAERKMDIAGMTVAGDHLKKQTAAKRQIGNSSPKGKNRSRR